MTVVKFPSGLYKRAMKAGLRVLCHHEHPDLLIESQRCVFTTTCIMLHGVCDSVVSEVDWGEIGQSIVLVV